MSSDLDMSVTFAGWTPELELGDVARRLQDIYAYLTQLNTYLNSATPSRQLITRLEVNSRALGGTITEIIDQIQKQDSLDIGDPDINEEVVGTLRSILTNLSAANTAKSLSKAAVEMDEVREAIADLADCVAHY